MENTILVTEPLDEDLTDLLRTEAAQNGFGICQAREQEEILHQIPNSGIFFGIWDPARPIPENIRWIALPLAGASEYLSLEAVQTGRCRLTCSSGAYGVTIAEHLIMLSLMLLRRMAEYGEDMRQGIWRHDRPLGSLYGSRVTVLGAGDIGCCFAERLRPFRPAAVTGVTRSGKSRSSAFDRVITTAALDQILPVTDLLVMALPETPETRDLMDARRLGLLPDGALVINVGRGSSLDQDALAALLREGRLGGAALDVLRQEPLPPDSTLTRVPHLIITPHMAGQRTLRRTRELMLSMFLENLGLFAAGEELRHLVDPGKGY